MIAELNWEFGVHLPRNIESRIPLGAEKIVLPASPDARVGVEGVATHILNVQERSGHKI
jgi:hypothetical protein